MICENRTVEVCVTEGHDNTSFVVTERAYPRKNTHIRCNKCRVLNYTIRKVECPYPNMEFDGTYFRVTSDFFDLIISNPTECYVVLDIKYVTQDWGCVLYENQTFLQCNEVAA